MKTSFVRSSPRAFSLIEILVVVSIIALLVGIALPAIHGAMNRARRLEARNTLQGLTMALHNYHAEYNRYPTTSKSSQDEQVELSSGNTLLKVLLGENADRLNSREFNFLDNVKLGRNGTGGLVGQEGSYSMVDPWGQPYRVVMDGNLDSRVSNPDVRNEDPSIAESAPANLIMGAIGMSAGPDKRWDTADDVVTWRQ
jgi:prepilin-type N-terminal cleavage/methylation domain-containing protein